MDSSCCRWLGSEVFKCFVASLSSFVTIPTPFMRAMHFAYFLPAVIQLAALLAVIPFISARPPQSHPSSLRSSPLGPRDSTPLATNWTSLGCITDDDAIPTLTSWSYSNQTSMTAGDCTGFCQWFGQIYAGLKQGTDCHCGNILSIIAENATSADCNMTCSGDPTETCGSTEFLDMYWSGAPPPPQPTMALNSSSGPWGLLGCYNDSNSARVLSDPVAVAGGQYNVSTESCTEACYANNFNLAGMEFGSQCYCSIDISDGQLKPSRDCMLPCSGNGSQICGGPNHLTMYLLYAGTIIPE